MKYTVSAGESEFEIEIDHEGTIRLDGGLVDADLHSSADPTLYSLILGHRSYELRVEPSEGNYRVQICGVSCNVIVEDERTRLLAGARAAFAPASGEVSIKSPMPGIVIDVPIREGESVTAGQTLVVVESMKMHNEFKAPRDGVVHSVRVAPGAKVEQNAILLTLN